MQLHARWIANFFLKKLANLLIWLIFIMCWINYPQFLKENLVTVRVSYDKILIKGLPPEVIYIYIFLLLSSLVAKKIHLKVNKWDVRGSNPNPLHIKCIISYQVS